jgi:hypothetical protein
MLEAALGDAFHEVNTEACRCIEALVGASRAGRVLARPHPHAARGSGHLGCQLMRTL